MILPERKPRRAATKNKKLRAGIPVELLSLLEAALEMLGEGYLLAAGPSREVVAATQAAANLLSVEREILIGKSLAELFGEGGGCDCGADCDWAGLRVHCRRDSLSGVELLVAHLSRSSAAVSPIGSGEVKSRDALTGLATRATLIQRLAEAQLRTASGGGAVALLFGDLDRFKPVNDLHGHHAGDQVLCEVAKRLTGCVRPRDLVCRYGGDEFVALVEGVSHLHEAQEIARRIAGEVAKPIEVGDESERTKVCVRMSLGVVVAEADSRDPLELIRRADREMYRAKAASGSALLAAARQG